MAEESLKLVIFEILSLTWPWPNLG